MRKFFKVAIFAAGIFAATFVINDMYEGYILQKHMKDLVNQEYYS